jgi:hypothetical protein
VKSFLFARKNTGVSDLFFPGKTGCHLSFGLSLQGMYNASNPVLGRIRG